MQVRFAIVSLTALAAVLVSAPIAQAEDDPITCGRYTRRVTEATTEARLDELLRNDLARDCNMAAAEARRKLALFAPAPPPVFVPPVTKPKPVKPKPIASPEREPATPPPDPAALAAVKDNADWADAAAQDTINAYQRYKDAHKTGKYVAVADRNIAKLKAQQTPATTRPSEPIIAKPAALDARNTPATTRAPVVSNPASLPDFALFRECENCPEMVVIPAGSFLMGSPANEPGRSADEDDTSGRGGRQVNVSVPRFAISRFEVTKADYAAFVAATGRADPKVAGNTYCIWRSPGFAQSDRDPVACVNTTDAEDYTAWLSRLGGGLYRLPSEAEWEYAARGGMSTRWSFGDAESQLGTYAWFSGNSGERTQPVGGKAPNPFGLFDMHGNVWEWVGDCYRDNLSGQRAAAYTTSGCSDRVYRGGSWYFYPAVLRSADRLGNAPSYRDVYLGFRVARTL